MDNLNKHQIILLALLVAFVSSIATGITVVSLLGQSPQPVAQTINRVVEKTIERVVSPTNNTNTPQEKTTVVVKEEDLTIDSVDKNSKSLVHIHGYVAGDAEAFVGDGVVVSDKGFIVADKTSLLVTNSYTGVLADGTKIPLEVVSSNDALGVTLLRAKPSSDQKVSFSPVSWADSNNVKLGQSVISLSHVSKNTVNIGNAVSVDGKDSKNTSITVSSNITNSEAGSVLINLSGEVVGFHTVGEKQVFTASNIVKDAVTALLPK